MRFSKKVLIGLIIFILLMTVADTVIFCIKGSYPVEIYLALVPTCITELVILYKLKMKESENDTSGRIEEADIGT
ncbi:MAG: hypothetical protein IKP66_08935 [Lachnospiraceae bacterium]|nr:hypothetical protein [Lachnospiraceae bacterium]